jgi:hypothetical protein
MKIGVSIKIDVTKIDKARLFKGEKGTYLDLTTFIDTDNPGQYGDHGFISQSVSKEEKAQKVQTPILGNCKVFYNGNSEQAHSGGVQQAQQAIQQPPTDDFLDDDIPF